MDQKPPTYLKHLVKGHFTHMPKIGRAQKRVSKGHPKTPPISCSVVMDPQV